MIVVYTCTVPGALLIEQQNWHRKEVRMKFNNGCWLQQEGCECFAPQQAYFTKVETDKVTICAPTNHINHRGDTLGGVTFQIFTLCPFFTNGVKRSPRP